MFGLYGPGNARDHACMLRLVKENDGRDIRFYHCGANPVLFREPWCVAVPENSPTEAAEHAREDGTRFVLITDTDLLQAGAADAFRQEGITVLGPDRHASRVEGSKALMKKLVREAGIPSPESWVVTSAKDAKTFLRNHWSRQDQFVIKTDRFVHDGKHRSMVPDSLGEGMEDVDEELAALFKAHEASGLVIERRVTGFETSVHVLCDGSFYVLLPPVRDYKQVFDGDRGPNTNGAAALAFGGGFPAELDLLLRKRIIEPALDQLQRAGYGYRGFIYFGVMLTSEGPVLLEINVRPGNPEFVALLDLLASDFHDLIEHAAAGNLHQASVRWHADRYSGCVFALAEDYPETEDVATRPIEGLEDAVAEGRTVTEGVGALPEGGLAVAGGRVAAPIANAKTIEDVKQRVYGTLSRIRFEGKHHRSDLGYGIAEGLFS
jgi:phosphoribosylamine---glycine ligase